LERQTDGCYRFAFEAFPMLLGESMTLSDMLEMAVEKYEDIQSRMG
jgi:hypothetical protein